MSGSEKLLADYAVILKLPVLWGQMDSYQHVNNTIYFRYFESGRMAYGERIDMYRFAEELGIGPILAKADCNFLKPLRYPDTIHIGCRTAGMTRSELHQEYAIYSEALDAIAAVGTAKVVAYDYRALKRAEYPQRLIDNVLRLEKNLQMG